MQGKRKGDGALCNGKKNTEDRYLKLLWWYTVYRNNAIRTYNTCQQAWKQLDCELWDLGKDLETEY